MRLRVTKLSATGWNDFFSGDPNPPGLAYLFLDDNSQVYLDNGNSVSIVLNNFTSVPPDNGD